MVGVLAARLTGGASRLLDIRGCAATIATAVACYLAALWLLPEAQTAVSIVARMLVLPLYLLLMYFSPALGDDGRAMIGSAREQLVRRILGPAG